jgi:hypothetical protein
MRIVKRMGPVLVAVCAFCAFAVSSASASLFLAHPPGLLLAKLVQTQVFHVGPAGNVECTGLAGHGIAATLAALTQEITVSYTSCRAFGLAAKITTVKYLFSADNGLVQLLNTVSITATGCTVTVLSDKNQSLQTVKYLNIGREIIVDPEVVGIRSSGTGAACTYSEVGGGTYVGQSLVIADTPGVVRWDP